MPYSPVQKHCIQMKDHKGKTTGIMMEGSAMHMSMLNKETDKQEKKDLMKDMPVDDKASAIEMSPYKMDHESPAEMSPYKMHNKEHLKKQGRLPLYMSHDGSPAEFTGMSGGSALHQEGDPDLSDMANLLFSKKKITKDQAKAAKEKVLANPMAKEKKKITEAEYVDRELTKRMKKKKMTPKEVLTATESIKGLYRQQNLGN